MKSEIYIRRADDASALPKFIGHGLSNLWIVY